MHKIIEMEGKQIDVEITTEANSVLSHRDVPLLAEMELYFSCLIRKKVRFHERADAATSLSVTDKLKLSFHPVMTKVCGKDYEGDEPPLTDFPIHNVKPYIPSWVKIDFLSGRWHGEFGYGKLDSA